MGLAHGREVRRGSVSDLTAAGGRRGEKASTRDLKSTPGLKGMEVPEAAVRVLGGELMPLRLMGNAETAQHSGSTPNSPAALDVGGLCDSEEGTPNRPAMGAQLRPVPARNTLHELVIYTCV